MNCQELKQDIEKLESLYSQFKNKYELSSESGLGKIELTNISNEANESVDEILERYLPDFKEHNPELLSWQLGEKIKLPCSSINSISILSDGSVLVGGNHGLLCHATEKYGGWSLEPIDGIKEKDWVGSILALPDGGALVVGSSGLYYATKKDSGWKLEGFGEFEGYGRIGDISILSDGSALIGRKDGRLYYATKKDRGWNLEPISGLEAGESIVSISVLHDGGALIDGWNVGRSTDDGISSKVYNTLYYVKQKDKGWELEPIGGVKEYERIETILALPDGSALVVGWNVGRSTDGKSSEVYNTLYYIKQKDKGWELEPIIDGFERKEFNGSISILPDGSVLIGGEKGKLYYATKKDGGWNLEPIDGVMEYEHIKYISTLPDGSALVVGWGIDLLDDGTMIDSDTLYYAKREDKGWNLEPIDGLKEYEYIKSISILPDGSVLIGGRKEELYHATKKDGSWNIEPIDGLEDGESINSISVLPDGSALIGESNGDLYHAIPPVKDVKTLRQHLSRIINTLK